MVIQDVNVPDIGDFSEVVVIEILVAKGDKVKAEQSLITVESDKASMEIPSPGEGVIEEILIKIGDKVSEGSLIMRMQQQAASEASLPAATSAHVHAQSAVDCDLLVLGAGPGGYSAAFRAADLGMKVILVERYATLGGVCLNVGCIPSKALLHIAAVSEEAVRLEKHGIRFAKPSFDLPVLRHWKQSVISKLTGGLASMAKQRKVEHLQAVARFTGTHSVALTESDGTQRSLRFSQAIIAAGSEAIRLPFLPDDPRIVDSTGALELPLIPERLLIIGGGIIGLEMATVYSSLGARLDVVEMLDGLMPGADRDLV
ncbi:MAG: FAD-dependent oxidoreductase, partial [Betaproteobacteria bacterium]|nr:FAD-dependent oxidoreductase [Betaproteobacteria bacterium]